MKIFKQYIAHEVNQGKQFSDDDDWRNITKRDFNTFRVTLSAQVISVIPSSAPSSTYVSRPPTIVDLHWEFKCGIKHKIMQFPMLKDNATWDN